MASPRKFSEKIAQHVQRQAEGNAAFEKIMYDVKSAKSKPYPRHALHPAPPYARSLPNVNQINSPSNEAQISFGCFDQGLGGIDVRPDVGGPYRPREKKSGGLSPGSSRHTVRNTGSGTSLNWPGPYSRTTDSGTNPVSTVVTSSSPMSVITVDKSTAPSQPFLSPPPFGDFWRRTNSDSALHQSLASPNSQAFTLATHCGHTCVDDGTICSPGQNHSSSASASPSPPSPSCHQHPGYESPGSISITCHPTSPEIMYDSDGDKKRTVQIIRRESPQMMSMVHSVGCGGDDPMKLMPDSSTSPSGSLPDLNAMHIPPPLPIPLDIDAQSPPVYQATVQSIEASRKYSHPSGIGSSDQSGAPLSSVGMMSNFSGPRSNVPEDLLSTHAKFFKYRGSADSNDRMPLSPCNQRSSSPGCDPLSAPASPSDSSPIPCQRTVFVGSVMSSPQNTGFDAFSLPSSSPTQTQNVLRRFQLINMVDSSTGTSTGIQPTIVTSTVPSLMSEVNGAVEVTISEEYSRLLQETLDGPSVAHQPPSSNHGIVITLTGPDSSETLNAASLSVTGSDLDSVGCVSDLPNDLSDIFGIDDYGTSEDAIRADLVPIDVDGFQLLMNPENNVTDAATEDHFRMDRL